jgi:hypothetical protein
VTRLMRSPTRWTSAHQVEELTEHGGKSLWIEHLRQGRDTLYARTEDRHFLTFCLREAVVVFG